MARKRAPAPKATSAAAHAKTSMTKTSVTHTGATRIGAAKSSGTTASRRQSLSAAIREDHEDLAQSQHKQAHARNEWFGSFAQTASRFTGKPATFIVAVLLVIVWAATGPFFHYSDTWQLVINTSTTIITFLMVFLIQNTQNRDMLAVQVKLAELIIAAQGAKNKLATAEDLTEEDLEALHKEYCGHAETAREHLERRRASKTAA